MEDFVVGMHQAVSDMVDPMEEYYTEEEFVAALDDIDVSLADDFSEDTSKSLRYDAYRFQKMLSDADQAAIAHDYYQAGYDYVLTRSGTAPGFLSGRWEASLAERLVNAAKKCRKLKFEIQGRLIVRL